MKGFLIKRLTAVLLPFWIINAIMTCVSHFFIQPINNPLNFVLFIVGGRLITGDGWYVVLAVLMYIAFYLLFRFIKKKYQWISYVGLFVLCFAYIAFCITRGHGDGSHLFQGEWQYNTVLIMPIGMVWAKFDKQILEFAKKTYWFSLSILGLLTVGSIWAGLWALENISYYAGNAYDPAYDCSVMCFGLQMASFIFFIAFLMFILMRVRLNNIVLRFLGTLTLEIYLSQRLVLRPADNVLFLLGEIALVVLASFILHFLIGLIQKPIYKLINKKKQLKA